MADILGVFEQAVLLSIVRLGDNAYGRAIVKDAELRLNRSVSFGAVQATLSRLEGKGLVRSELGPGSEARGGRPRRFYELTPMGSRALNETRQSVAALWRGFRPQRARS
jgi:DNA-binding PadR family transcriptional regulator